MSNLGHAIKVQWRKRNLKKGSIWYFRLPNDPKRSWLTTKATTRVQAEIYVDRFLRERRSPGTLAEFAHNFFDWDESPWIDRQRKLGYSFSRSVAQSRARHLVNYILPSFGASKLQEIKRADVEDWLVGLSHPRTNRKLAAQTKKHVKYTFNILMAEAERQELVAFNPIVKIEKLGTDFRRRDTFTQDDLRKLFPTDRERLEFIWSDLKWATLFHLLASTGLRSGEARALQWQHVRWERQGLIIAGAFKDDGSLGTTKTGDGRAVLLFEGTLQLLRAWHQTTEYRDADALIFHNGGPTQPLVREYISRSLRPAMQRAGVDFSSRNLVVHSLRHTFNTAARKSLPLEVVQELTGHSSDQMTDHYDHPTPVERLSRLSPVRDVIARTISWEPEDE